MLFLLAVGAGPGTTGIILGRDYEPAGTLSNGEARCAIDVMHANDCPDHPL
jgi:hypothetical protein